jgi:hypothetical protein
MIPSDDYDRSATGLGDFIEELIIELLCSVAWGAGVKDITRD